jgi:hypothetical protein
MDEEQEFDPGNRQLCPDGTCVGLVRADGRCAVCGQAGGQAPPRGAGPRPAQADAEMTAGAPDPLTAASGSQGADRGDEDGFDANRKLCEDGTCVGVLGPDGRCLVCGRASGVSES